MEANIQRFREIFNADDETPETQKIKRRIILAATVPANIATIILSVINAYTTTPAVMFSTIFLSASLLIINILLLKNAPIKYVALSFFITVCPVFTFYIIAGGAEGFDIYWILLIPLSIFTIFGLKVGLITSIYFLVLICVFFYTSAKSLLLYEYPRVVLLRFPILYILSFIFSFTVNFHIKTLRLRQLNHNSELRQSVLTDPLTNIPNRRYFNERLPQEWERAVRSRKPISLLMLDLDHFKVYNDTYGHLNGDKVLQAVSNIFSQEKKRPADFVVRWGGEEFVVLLPETDSQGAIHLAEDIRKRIEETEITLDDGIKTKITISIGINSIVPTHNSSYDDFIRNADDALYKAKEKGRNRYCLYSGMNQYEEINHVEYAIIEAMEKTALAEQLENREIQQALWGYDDGRKTKHRLRTG
jgi:diguanylate cyclase (GGDEF)-like protein